MSYEMIGKLHKKFDTESKTSNFQAREFVLESMESTYTQYIKFQLTQDRCGIIEPYKEGEELKVFFDLRGREWNGRYFTNLNAWKIEKNTSMNSSGEERFPDDPFPTEEFNTSTSENKAEDFDDLPF